ncbi:hypothetical protein ACFQPG_04165 [Sphingomonas sp. GCM10030256]|uniref:hypothetical protein n=1 Tax=Sphingomonas sp. GCM10030256 TaxID=3273427 RepID=UPI003619995B
MIHFLPDSATATEAPAPYAEAVARLASIRQALRIVDMIDGKPARPVEPMAFEQAWPLADEPKRRCFERRSLQVANGAAAGLEALVGCQSAGQDAHPRAVGVLSDDLRAGLEDLERLFAGRA